MGGAACRPHCKYCCTDEAPEVRGDLVHESSRLHDPVIACTREGADGLDDGELRHALNAIGLYPNNEEIKEAIAFLNLSRPVLAGSFSRLAKHLGRTSCARGEPVLPHFHRGVSLRQLEDLEVAFVKTGWLKQACEAFNAENAAAIRAGGTRALQENMYGLDSLVIRPVTSSDASLREGVPPEAIIEANIPEVPLQTCSYAQLMNQEGLKSDVFVTHHWGHNFSKTVAALEHYAADAHALLGKRTSLKVTFWMCAFALDQHTVSMELLPSAKSGPFNIALGKVSGGLLMVLDERAEPFSRIWCLFEVLRASELGQSIQLVSEKSLLRFCWFPGLVAKLIERLFQLSLLTSEASSEEERAHLLSLVLDPKYGGSTEEERPATAAIRNFKGLDAMAFCAVEGRVRSLIATELFKSAVWIGEAAAALQALGLGAECSPEDLQCLRALKVNLDSKVPACLLGVHGRAPLVGLLAHAGRSDPLRSLLDWGIDMEQRTNLPGGTTEMQRRLHDAGPLALAAQAGQLPVVSLLLARRADANARAGQGTVLLCAITEHICCAAIVRLLLEQKADPSGSEHSRGHHPLHAVVALGNKALASTLLDNAASLEARAGNGASALHMAADSGRLDLLTLLLERRADVAARREDGATPLHLVALAGHIAAVPLLLDRRADVQAKDNAGKTAAQLANADGLSELGLLLRRPM
mmetsp:Transcript_23613/g.52342  ORF Transcript_23613/g.52342 Transcript_23613/m.52342 type:complete len:697 (-) Transcript_23613:128-2218(-)